MTAIVLAHFYSTPNYDWTKNTISDLGAQGYNRKWIMQFGFLLFGILLLTGIILNGIFWKTLPILVYGICIALTGIFCTTPFFEVANYSSMQAALHSFFAQIAGLAFSIGIVVQFFYDPDKKIKYIHLVFFILVIGCSVAFGVLKIQQGIVQRLLYLVSFIWFIKFYKT